MPATCDTAPMDSSRPTVRQIYAFLLMFLLLWTGAWLLHVAVTRSLRNTMVGGSVVGDTLFWVGMKLLVWVVFPYRYFRRRVRGTLDFIGLSRRHIGKGMRYGLAAATVWVAGSYATSLLSHQAVALSVRSWLILGYAAVFTPAVEELVFRGYVLSGLLANGVGFWKANLSTSLAFLLPHLVGWSFQGLVVREIQSTVALSVVVLSLYLGYIRTKSESLAGGYLVHLANNAFVNLLR